MDYFDTIVKAVDFIENNLKNDISQEQVAEFCGFSVYHFHRVFQYAVNDSITGYIRERRLTSAAIDLLTSHATLLDLALDYHFESHESFARAFKKMFGIPPGEFRNHTESYKTLIRVSQRRRMDPRIVQHLMHGLSPVPQFLYKEAFTVIGVSMHSTDGDNFSHVWNEFNQRRSEISDVLCDHALGLISRTGKNVEFNYIACVEVSSDARPPTGMVCLHFPSNQYAVFTHKGEIAHIDHSWTYALGTWLPKSKMKRATGPAFELYHPTLHGTVESLQHVDIYIPIQMNA